MYMLTVYLRRVPEYRTPRKMQKKKTKNWPPSFLIIDFFSPINFRIFYYRNVAVTKLNFLERSARRSLAPQDPVEYFLDEKK